ncbi:MAG TPA: hypothetical protein VEW73_01840, partial [Nocardioides sp.]|nr:hypothetical protein [Nocardioides sp.]
MTLTVEDDFRAFVSARWPDLEGVAFVVTLDPGTARRVTAEALATLHQQWGAALDEGRPGATARRSVLTAAVAAARPGAAGVERPVVARPPGRGADAEEDEPVLTALEDAVRASTPLERALVGAGSVWGAEPDEVADLLGLPLAEVRQKALALRARLVATHDEARAAQGLAPADWALDVDLDAVVENLLGGQGDPPDPAALVEERRRSVQRRSLVAGGAATVAAGAVAWWALGRGPDPSGASTASATPGRLGLPPPDDPSWDKVASWTARGALATDPRVQGLVVSGTSGISRLLFADDVAGRRLVVSGTSNPGTDDVILQAWQGERGDDPTTLKEVPFQSPFVPGGQDAMVLAVPTSPGTLLVVLARPSVTEAAYSLTVIPTVEGTVRREWVGVPVVAGIGSTRLPDDPGPALRGRAAGFDGPAIGTA